MWNAKKFEICGGLGIMLLSKGSPGVQNRNSFWKYPNNFFNCFMTIQVTSEPFSLMLLLEFSLGL